MAEIGAAVVGGGIALAVAGYSNGTGFVARHETAHAQQVAETKRIIVEFEEAYKRGEVSEEDWKKFLEIRTDVRDKETEYEESIEDYKEIPIYQFITKWKKLHKVREKKRKLRKVNRTMRKHYYDSTSDASDASSVAAESGSPPRKLPRVDRYSDDDEKRVLSWANHVACESDGEGPTVEEKQYGDRPYMSWGHKLDVNTVSFSPDGQEVLSSDSLLVSIANWATRTSVNKRLDDPTPYRGSAVTFSPDCQRVVARGESGVVLVWDAHTGRLLSKVQGRPDNGEWGSWRLAFTMGGKRVMSLCKDGTVQLLDIVSGESTFCPLEGVRPFSPFKPSSDSTCVAFSSRNNVLISDLHTGKNIAGPMRGHTGIINTLTFSSDDSLVVSGSIDETIRLWDSRTSKAAFSKPLSGHTNQVKCVEISSDGRRIVSGSTDATVRIWDTRTGKSLRALDGHSSEIGCVAFSPDGSKVVSGSIGGTVQLWDISISGAGVE